jgi:hypothetical protein
MMKIWFSLHEYARTRSFRVKTIRNYCAQGMPHMMDGKKIVISPLAADNWIMEKRSNGCATTSTLGINDRLENLFRKKG